MEYLGDQGDTLMLRDFAWLQFYCETSQEVLDTTLLAFKLAEDHRILLPVMTCMDAFIVSHTQSETDLPEQDEVDRFLPDLDLPQRMHPDEARTLGGMTWPHDELSMRLEIDEAMNRVPHCLPGMQGEFHGGVWPRPRRRNPDFCYRRCRCDSHRERHDGHDGSRGCTATTCSWREDRTGESKDVSAVSRDGIA